jgi:septum formation protein
MREMLQPPLILASGSPRRKSLLEAAGVEFQVIESGVDEIRATGESARDFSQRVAGDKARAVSLRFPVSIVLGADTVVECGGEILGKPSDPADARRMLRLLSGNTHVVVTAFALARGGAVLESAIATSRVTFRALASEEITAYLETGEPFDKAGSYGIQGIGGGFISAVEGSRDNVMGLPVDEVLRALRALRARLS